MLYIYVLAHFPVIDSLLGCLPKKGAHLCRNLPHKLGSQEWDFLVALALAYFARRAFLLLSSYHSLDKSNTVEILEHHLLFILPLR
jgi:hypothetical protein